MRPEAPTDSFDPTDAAGNARTARLRQDAAAAQARSEAADVAWLMSGQRGRRIVWRWLERAGVFRLSFSVEPLQMAFAEGCRNEGLRLLAQVQPLPTYAQMLAECAPQPQPPTHEQEATH